MNRSSYQTLGAFMALVLHGSANTENLLLNSGFEEGLSEWTATGNAALKIKDASSELPAYEGSIYIYGSATPEFTVSQTIELADHGISTQEIDEGSLRAYFGGWQAGYYTQRDNGTISIRFLDAYGLEIGSSSLPSFYSYLRWEKQSGVAAVPAQTRYIQFHFLGIRLAGSGNDAYLDAAFLTVIREPSLTINSLGIGAVELNFTGLLYESDDLISWTIIENQPLSPYRFFPSRQKKFFQAR